MKTKQAFEEEFPDLSQSHGQALYHVLEVCAPDWSHDPDKRAESVNHLDASGNFDSAKRFNANQ